MIMEEKAVETSRIKVLEWILSMNVDVFNN